MEPICLKDNVSPSQWEAAGGNCWMQSRRTHVCTCLIKISDDSNAFFYFLIRSFAFKEAVHVYSVAWTQLGGGRWSVQWECKLGHLIKYNCCSTQNDSPKTENLLHWQPRLSSFNLVFSLFVTTFCISPWRPVAPTFSQSTLFPAKLC